MDKNLYIDASHPDETRIVLKSNLSIEEYEYEDKNRVNFKNNIYLGTISRVEPSLQAAFVDFGRVKHGFLAFNDIQSDYYQIPSEDKEKLKSAEEKIREDLKNTDLEEINNNKEAASDGEKNEITEEQNTEEQRKNTNSPQTNNKTNYREKLLEKTLPILFENKTKDGNKYFGRDEYFNSVIVESNYDLTGKIMNVRILKVNQNTLYGEVISNLNQTHYAA